jgi:hypothetical protein
MCGRTAWKFGCGRMGSPIEELAKRERVNRGYMSRMLRLTLLAPEIVEAMLDGRQPEGTRLEDLPEGFPVEWAGQSCWLARFQQEPPVLTAIAEAASTDP